MDESFGIKDMRGMNIDNMFSSVDINGYRYHFIKMVGVWALGLDFARINLDDPAFIDGLRQAVAMKDEVERRIEEITEQSRLEREAKIKATPRPERKKRRGFVYVLKAETGHYKIGKAVKPEDRYSTFTVKLPFRVEYEMLIASDDYAALEKELHERFADKRLDGEWFALTPEDIEALRKEHNDATES